MLDPLRSDAGVRSPFTLAGPPRPPEERQDLTYPGFADLMSGDCSIDGVPAPCSMLTDAHVPYRGVLDLTPADVQTEALERTPVQEVRGVGPACAKLLKAAGLTTARKLRDADRRWIRQRMTVAGARIVEELRGVSCLPLKQCPSKKKSVTCSRSLCVPAESLAGLREAVAL